MGNRVGSSPTADTSDAPVAQWIEYLTTNQVVVGSNPARRANGGLAKW
jgi:hypothetical protein